MMGDWFKSSFSGPTQNCVEMKQDHILPEYILIRDSKDPDSPVLYFTKEEIAAFIADIKGGKYDEIA